MSGSGPTANGSHANDALQGRQSPTKSFIPTRFSLLAPSPTSFQEHEEELGQGYQLQAHDVICGSSREFGNHPGNGRYKVLIEMRLERYREAKRPERSRIVREVVSAVRESGGNFVRFSNGLWYDVGNGRAREKTGSAIRCLVKAEAERLARRESSRISSNAMANAVSTASRSTEEGVVVGAETGRLEEGFAFSSPLGNLGVVDTDLGRLSPEPIGALPSRIRKPDGFDEFVRNTFLHESSNQPPEDELHVQKVLRRSANEDFND